MKIEDILFLGAMGYTKEDIEAMSQQVDNDLTEKTERAPEPEPVKTEPEPAPDPNNDLLKLIVSKFDDLNKSIQTANILNSNINKPKEKTAEDVLAEIVAPPKKGR